MPDTTPGQNGAIQGEGTQPAVLPTTNEPQVTGELPVDASERTKREFEKLKEHNKQLADKVASLETGAQRSPSVLETYLSGQSPVALPQQQMPATPPMGLPPIQTNLPQGKVETIRQELIDRDGYVNADELERRVHASEQAEVRAREAEMRANQALERIARFEADAKNAKAKQLYTEFPELDPSSDTYNRQFSEAVVDEMLLQIVKTGQQDPIVAAQKLQTTFRKPPVPATPTPAQQARSQASASPRGQARPNALKAVDMGELKERSYYSNAAMEERIRRAGI